MAKFAVGALVMAIVKKRRARVTHWMPLPEAPGKN
ncbi:DUF551 domain-containing protein [Cronobacter sakazakii]|nr:DUF551 domain-containing protein [Cronobacter sakazakii]ELY4259774.1 DUF551 domain-containing protein [Cronobacter sakazakii]ELY4669203.1 DUF551 domain-containing protein [Cronobacter sakazakii]